MGVRYGPAIWIPWSIFNRGTGFIFAKGILSAAVGAIELLTGLAGYSTAASGTCNRRRLVSILERPMELPLDLCQAPNVFRISGLSICWSLVKPLSINAITNRVARMSRSRSPD
jgi:hypothetical protein